MSEHLGSYYTLKVEGEESFELKEGDLESVLFKVDSPNESTSKSTRMEIIIQITGLITHHKNEAETLKLATWALIPAGNKNVERKVTIEIVKAHKVIRLYTFSHAFIIDYFENINDSGSGNFNLYLKQNSAIDKAKVEISGGYDK